MIATRAHLGQRELAYREIDGVEVSLLWDPRDDSLTVAVTNWRTGEAFDVAAERHNALDVFQHPYVHASQHTTGPGAGTLYAL